MYEDGTLSYILTEEGRLVAVGTGEDRKFLNEYNLKDHLGNNRVTFMGTDLGGAVDVVQTTNYYPFGLVMNQTNGNTASGYQKNKYLYNGKELQSDKMTSESLNWYDYGARFYDPQIGRWHVADPHSENYLDWSPYNYVANNPLNLIDPDGMDWYDFSKDDNPDIQWRDGSEDQLKPGLWNKIKNIFGAGDYSKSLGAEVLVITGQEDGEQVNEASFEFYSSDNTEGPTTEISGNTIPADINSMNTMAEGLYTETSVINDYHGSGIKAISFDEGTVESTEGVPMTYVRAHRGNIFNDGGRYDTSGTPWSTGCPTFGYGTGMFQTAKDFADNFTNNTNVYLKRK